jgi:hypothetical protein
MAIYPIVAQCRNSLKNKVLLCNTMLCTETQQQQTTFAGGCCSYCSSSPKASDWPQIAAFIKGLLLCLNLQADNTSYKLS